MLKTVLCTLALAAAVSSGKSNGGDPVRPFSVEMCRTNSSRRIQRAEIADLAFLVDITGSMQRYIDGTRDAILEIVDSLPIWIRRLRVAFVGYRDFEDTPHFEVLDFTWSVNNFRSFLCRIRARGGRDLPEDVFGGLEKVGQLNWSRAAGTRVLIHIADAPCHGSQYHDFPGTYPGGDPEGRSLYLLLHRLRCKRVLYSFGRISASRTDEMIREFSTVWGGTIPQFDIASIGGSRPCNGTARRKLPTGRVAPGGASEDIARGTLQALRAANRQARNSLG